MWSYIKQKKWLVLNALLVGVLVSLLGVQIVDRNDAVDRSVRIGIGNEKVITLGHVAYAAGSVDYTYDGTNDNVQFQAALDALPATGGRIVDVSAVQKNFSATVTRAIPNVTIEGSGFGSYFANNGVTALFTAGGNDWTFSYIRTDAGGINMGATTGWLWIRVNNGATAYDWRTSAGSIVNGAFIASSVTDSGLTNGRLPIAGVGGLLGDDADLTFSGDTVTVTNIADSSLTSGRLPVAGVGGLLRDSSNLTWTNPSLQVGGANVTRAVSFRVAASNAPAYIKAQSDYVADGVADEVQIQAAINALPVSGGAGQVGGGKVVLSEGTFTFSASVNISLTDGGPIIEGMGRGTRIVPPDGDFAFSIGSAGKFSYGTVLRGFSLGNANGKGINIPNGDTILIENVYANYIDTFIQALGDAGETNWLTIRNSEAFYIGTTGLDINAHMVLVDKVYLHSTALLGATHLRLRSDVAPQAIVIRNSLFEIGARGARIDGGVGVVIENSRFTGLTDYAISMSSSNGLISRNQFHNITGTPIIVPAGVTGVTIEYNKETGADPGVASVNITGYNNDGFRATGNSLGGTLGVIEDATNDGLKTALGIKVNDADFAYLFSNADGVTDRVWESTKTRNLWLYNTPTWGTVDGTSQSILTMNGTETEYGRFPDAGYDDLVNVSGSKTLVCAGRLNFIPDGHVQRHFLGLNLVGGATPNNLGFYYDWNVLYFSAGGTTGNSSFIVLRDGSGANAWALGDPVVLVGTINGVTMKGYLNGVYIGTIALDSVLGSSVQTVWLNTRSDLTRLADADYVAALLLPRVLSDDDIATVSARLLGFMGARSDNSGTGTIVTGTTAIAVTHGLPYPPALQNLSVTPLSTLGNASYLYIADNATATQFWVSTDVDPTTANVTFAWKYAIR